MGDIYPYGPSLKYSVDDLRYYMSIQPGVTPDPNIMAAIAIAESDGDVRVINDTPSTGDYSVGAWQINYFDGLYADRTAEFGTPQQLVQGGVTAQAHAAVVIWRQQGYGAWSTYTSGAYQQYLGPGPATGPGFGPGQQTAPLTPPIGQGIDAWDGQVRLGATIEWVNANTALTFSRLVDAV